MMYDEDLLTAMEALAERQGLRRVEVQLDVEELAPDGKTILRNPHSILFLPGLGWTAKNDLRTPDWGQARIIGKVFTA